MWLSDSSQGLPPTVARAFENWLIDTGVVEATNAERRHFWKHWQHFMDQSYPTIQHDLSNIDKQQQVALLGAFSQHVRTGQYNPKNPGIKRAQTVEVALRAVSQTITLDGQPSPLETAQGGYPFQLRRQLDSFKKQDPPPREHHSTFIFDHHYCLLHLTSGILRCESLYQAGLMDFTGITVLRQWNVVKSLL
jgi:hypothetical protein